MLSREGALLLISNSSWLLIISILFFQPFLLLTVFLLHSFISFYIILSQSSFSRLRPDDLSVSRIVEVDEAGGGLTLRVHLTVALRFDERLYVEVFDSPPAGTAPVGTFGPARGVVGGGSILSHDYALRVVERMGSLSFRAVIVRVHDPLKLVYRELQASAPTEVALPIGEESVVGLYTQLSSMSRPPLGMGVRSMVGYDDEFAGVKQYEVGDKIRDIHWLRYARQVEEEQPVTKKYRKRGEVSVHVVVDCSPTINLGKDHKLIDDVATLLRQIFHSADKEGNPVQLWLINPRLPLEAKVPSRKTTSRAELERYLSLLTPADGRDDGEVAELFAGRVSRSSIVILLTNPPTPNLRTVEKIIAACRDAGATCHLVLPETSSYVEDGPTLRALLRIDRVFKDSWLRRAGGVEAVMELRRGEAYEISERILRRR
jgi:uncharacterized protein (DUF58 family)